MYRFRATFSETEWEDDEPDTEPIITHGFTDPNNPWGGLDAEMPEDCCGEDAARFIEENADVVEFETLEEAVEFMADFPGGIWDYSESESEQDYRTGVYREVTLHVVDSEQQAELFEVLRQYETKRDAELRAYKREAMI